MAKTEEDSGPSLPNIIVEDRVPDSKYRSVELEVYELGIKLTDEDTETETDYSVKLHIPLKVNGHFDFHENLIYRIGKMLEDATGFTRDFYSDMILNLQFYLLCPPSFFVFERNFEIATFGYKPAFLELAEYLDKKDQPNIDLLKEVGKTDAEFSELFDYATYKAPPVSPTFSDRCYAEFKRMFFDELLQVNMKVQEIKEQAFDELIKQVSENKGMKENEKNLAIEKLQRAAENDERFLDITSTAIRNILSEAIRGEAESDEKNSAFADRAFKMILKIANGVDFSAPENEISAILESRFDLIEYSELLGSIIAWYEKEYRIPPLQKKGATPVEFEKLVEQTVQQAKTDPTPLQHLALIEAMRTENFFDKLKMLVWISDNFTNRLAYVERMYRDAATVYHAVISWGYQEVYKKIRHILTREEKRAYKLMFFPHSYFGNRIAAQEPRVRGFIFGMDDETILLGMAGLIFREKSVAGYEDALAELEKRWKAYLRVYPCWAVTVLDEERIEKSDSTYTRRVTSLYKSVRVYDSDRKGEKRITLEDKLSGPEEWEPEHIIDMLTTQPDNPDLHKWVNDYCTKQQRGVIKTMFLTGSFIGLNQCAEIVELAPSTIRNHLKAGILNIREHLVRDNIYPPERFKPLRRMDLK